MKIFKSLFGSKKIDNYLIDRDLSWLKFNKRVLEEANDKKNPLLERVRFLSISGNNLDEFLMVRLAGLNRMILEKIPMKSLSNLSNKDLLNEIMIELNKIHKKQLETWNLLKKRIEKKKIFYLWNKRFKKKR